MIIKRVKWVFYIDVYTMRILRFIIVCTCLGFSSSVVSARQLPTAAANHLESYLPLLKNKKVALVVNPTSLVGETHLADTLHALGISLQRIFGPEHGFRGKADAGEHVDNEIDARTGVPVISLYGAHKKPTAADMQNLDWVVFDIQDVGARFYTYISTLQYVMEACAENNVPLLILDRPNPNGFYVDGPVLEPAYRSFVGMQCVPIVHGMTVGEYARMLNGEHWLKEGEQCALQVMPCWAYDHHVPYYCPVPPSPNLKTPTAVFWYPTLCLFEGTDISVGRGTEHPFEMFGHPDLKTGSFAFTPISREGAKSPPHKDQTCFGTSLQLAPAEVIETLHGKINLDYLLSAYHDFPKKDSFFTPFFTKLSGTEILRKQMEQGMSEASIRQSWQHDIEAFKVIRKKYLLYTDFE